MSLVSYINKYCPNGVSHSHCNGYNMGLKSKKKCALCTNNKIRKNFSRICSKYYEIKTYFFGSAHPAIAASLNNLAVLYVKQGLINKAIPLVETSLGILERTLGSEHRKTKNVKIKLESLKLGKLQKIQNFQEPSSLN